SRSDGGRSLFRASDRDRPVDVPAADHAADAGRLAAEDDDVHHPRHVHRVLHLPARGLDDLYSHQHDPDLLAAVAVETRRRQPGATDEGCGEAGEGMMEEAANVLRTILTKMGVEHEVVPSETEERVTLEIKGPETGLII